MCLLLVQEVNLRLYKHVLPYKFGLYKIHTNLFFLFFEHADVLYVLFIL